MAPRRVAVGQPREHARELDHPLVVVEAGGGGDGAAGCIAQLQHVDELPDDTPILNRRERQCLTLVGQGKGDIQIGTTLGVQRSTAHNYVEGAKKRLGLRQRTPAVLYAIGSRQIRLEDILCALHPVVRRRKAR